MACGGAVSHAPILVVDNHDSFVHTLVGYLHELGADTDLVEADAIVDPAVAIHAYRGVLVSPGPGVPADAGASIAVVRAAADSRIPLLGVCLGHQAIGEAFGATVAHAPELMHGMTSLVEHDHSPLYDGLPSPFTATRYHSLAIVPETLPADLVVTSRTESGVIMGVAHRTRRRGSVPSRERAHRGWAPAAGQLARDGRICGCRGPRRPAAPPPLTRVRRRSRS